MKILFASSEIVPFASTGGLGDVAAALPVELARQGHEVIRMMPLYQQIDREAFGLTECESDLWISLGHAWYYGSVWTGMHDGVRTYFIHSEEFFERHGIYGHAGHGFGDNFERFLFFQKCVVKLIDDWKLQPDIVHCNDWQTGLLPMLLRYGIDGNFRNRQEKTLFTIHNLAHQGWAPPEKFYMTSLPDHCYTMETLECYNEINTLKGGLVAASAINTVSPTYAKEIQTRWFGCKLEGVLRHRSDVLHGILNGIDNNRWNPETDPYIAGNYSARDLSGKEVCKLALQKEAGFDADAQVPLLGVISRLVPQKGINLLMHTMQGIIDTGCQLVILGSGDAQLEKECREWAERYPKQVCAWIEFSVEKAHKIEAGADIFLMPSDFEPCGQNQLYSMRYGTIPLVHGVGGLEDSVVDAGEAGGTGFKFHGHSAHIFADCLGRALKLYRNKTKWNVLVKRAMKQDFSVVHMASAYVALYEKTIATDDAKVD